MSSKLKGLDKIEGQEALTCKQRKKKKKRRKINQHVYGGKKTEKIQPKPKKK